MSGGGGNTNTTTTSNAPPQEYLDAYKKITERATGVAGAPYSPYPGQKLADFSPDQQAGIQGVRNAQGISDPYINAGAQYIDRATQPIWDNSTHPDAGMMAAMPGQAMGRLDASANGDIGNAASQGANNIYNAGNAGVSGIWGQTAAGQTGINNASSTGGQGILGQTAKGVSNIDNYTKAGVDTIYDYTGQGVSNILGATGTFRPDSIRQFEDPYTQSVVDAMGRDFQNQNDIQQQGIIGDAIGRGAWGGDRSAVAQGIIAGQQARAQDPIMAQLRSTGYQQATQAAEEQGRQRIQGTTNAGQLGVQGANYAGQLGVQGATNSGQLGVQGATNAGAQALQGAIASGQLGVQGATSAGGLGAQTATSAGDLGLRGATGQSQAYSDAAKTQLGFYGNQQGAELGAKQAEGWLNMQGAGGMGSLGNQALNSRLTGSNALLGVGGMEQGQAQAGLNIPYQEWQANQAYPFQTTGWLSNIVQGLGSASGGTGSTTSPGPSLASQYGGLATAGVGALGQSGAFGKEGWLTGSGGGSSGSWTTPSYGGVDPALSGINPSSGGIYRRGGMIPGRAVGGGIIPRYAFGGPTSGIGPLDGTKPLDEGSVVPEGIAGGGKGKIFGDFGQTATTSGGPQKDSELGSLIKTGGQIAAAFWGGPAGAAAGSAFNSQVHFDRGGGIIDNDEMYRNVPRLDGGGSVSIMESKHGGPGIPQLTGGGGGGAGIAPSGSVDDYLASQAKGRVALPPPPPVAATNGPAKSVPDVPKDDPEHNIYHIPNQSAPGTTGGYVQATPAQLEYLMDPAYVQAFPGDGTHQGAIYNREGHLVRQSDVPGQIFSYNLPGFNSMGDGGGGGEAFGGRIGREEGGDIPQEAPRAPAEPEQNVDIKIPDVGDPTPSVNSTLGLPEGYMGGPTVPQGAGIIAPPQGGSASPAPQGPHGPVPMQAGPGYVPPPPELAPVVQQAAAKYGVDPKQLAWLLSTESRWNPKAYNRLSGTMGIGQFKPGTAAEMQIDPWDPQQAIMGAAGYLRKMLDKNGGDYERAIGRYGTFSTGQGKEADEAVRQRYRAFMAGTQSVARGGGIVGLAGGGDPYDESSMLGSNPYTIDSSDPETGLTIGRRADRSMSSPPDLARPLRTMSDPTGASGPGDSLVGLGASTSPTPAGAKGIITPANVNAPPPPAADTSDGGGDTGAGIPAPPPAPPVQAGSPDADKDKEDNPKVSGWQKLMNVGLGIMSGTSPHALVNVGAGALKGIALSDKEQQTLEAAATRRDVAKTNAVWRAAQAKNAGLREDRLGRQGDERLSIQQQEVDRKKNRDAAISEFNQWKMANGNATTEQRNRRIDELIRNHNLQNDRDLLKIDQKGELFYAGDETKRDIAGQVSEDRRRGQDTRSADAAASREIRITRNGVLERQGDQRLDMTAQGLALRQQQILNSQSASDERNRLRAQGLDDARIRGYLSDSARIWALNPGKRYPDVVREVQAQDAKLRGSTPPRPSLSSPSKQAVTPPTGTAPSWVQPGDQYSAKLNRARRADGTTYGPDGS
jgi:hypothetical protein